ncbi:hypothetical protein [Parafrankia elaeagni]|uniref:hypothetical protein n=1 Tax=Parafrankia elaeagni TaxID=222534 RepID=UPI00037B8C11|nr:hypothetical protein [Parafrankia elaeagni]
MRNPATRFSRLAAVTAALGVALTLSACGGGDDGSADSAGTATGGDQSTQAVTGPRNGIESKPAVDIVTAAADALREAGSVRYVGRNVSGGRAASVDLRLGANGTVTGTLDQNGQRVEVIRIDDVAYIRGTAGSGTFPGARPDQWINTGGIGASDDLTITGAADEILEIRKEIEGGEQATVEEVTEQGTPAVKLTTKSSTLFVSLVGPALPLHQLGDKDGNTLDATFSEFGKPVVATAPTDVFQPPTIPGVGAPQSDPGAGAAASS